MWNSIWQDICYAARMMQNYPGFSAVLIVCLSLGIGPTTTTFSLINASLLHPVDVESPERLFAILSNRVGSDRPSQGISFPNFLDLQDRSKTLDIFVAADVRLSVRWEDSTELLNGAMVSPNFFDVLGRRTILGDTFHADNSDIPGSQPQVVLGHYYWMQKFHGSREAVGKKLRINGYDYTIIGVMAPGFTGHTAVVQPTLWVSMSMMDQIRPDVPSRSVQRNHSWMTPIARIRSDFSKEQATQELANISAALASEFPQTNEFLSFAITPFTGLPHSIEGDVSKIVGLAGVVVFLLLLLSCTSTAALLLARATVRQREIAIRMAIGATRWRIFRQLLVESIFTAFFAGGLGLLFTLWGFELYRVLLPQGLNEIVLGASVDFRVLGFTIVISVVAGVLFGLAPAWQMSRTDLIAPLKSHDQGGDYGSAKVRNVLVASQFALAIILLISSGLFIRSLRRAQILDPGFETQQVAVYDIDLSMYGYSMQNTEKFIEDFVGRVGQLPGVTSVGVSRFPPLSAGSSIGVLTPIGEDLKSGPRILVGQNTVAPGYFNSLDIALIAGRDFSTKDSDYTGPVIIINESLAKHFGGTSAALGKIAALFSGETAEVIGVVKDSKYNSFGEDGVNFMYSSLAQVPTRELAFCIRSDGDAQLILSAIANTVRDINNDLSLSPLRTMRDHLKQSLAPARLSAMLFGILGGLALLLAVIGVYGVVSYSVVRRRQEIGIRMALGGLPRDIVGLMIRNGMKLVVVGAIVGIIVALGVTRFLSPLLNGGSPTDWQVFVLVPLILLVIAWLAIWMPARKATKVNPMEVLRYE